MSHTKTAEVNTTYDGIVELLGSNADSLLNHECKTVSKDLIHLPGGDFIDRVFINTNRNNQVLRNLNSIYIPARK